MIFWPGRRWNLVLPTVTTLKVNQNRWISAPFEPFTPQLYCAIWRWMFTVHCWHSNIISLLDGVLSLTAALNFSKSTIGTTNNWLRILTAVTQNKLAVFCHGDLLSRGCDSIIITSVDHHQDDRIANFLSTSDVDKAWISILHTDITQTWTWLDNK